MTYSPKNDPSLIIEYEVTPAFSGSGESGYSLGEPPTQPIVEITAVAYNGADVTEFVVNYCDRFIFDMEETLTRKEMGVDS